MPNVEDTIVTVDIVGREFKIKCPKEKILELQKAAKYLNEKMQEVQHGDKAVAIDRVAITTALNISHELILEKQHLEAASSDICAPIKRLVSLKEKLDLALASID